ncbi:glycogen synthase GlgA [Coraliomargarita akajimensis]|uniref:Glycogen synthase n=1 Tax=Coraliomargarita akajimensis (strain DSM 45221 / IAM 15411 / JCM 23193 / KCTC 12865 / 04OKA010-24) TaxID=583355 RepID=D5EHV8_CORAD|nr:glycogen synthase GlgA [Coraliomargarita akajimensis]ADE54149.1 glycogen/starch synthase, ADP-glucose type [Coraliomargarita akajimensis DSM 45221]
MGEKRKILMVAPEAAPFIKVGGLADVVGALSKALDLRGHDVRIVLPKYAGMRQIEAAVADSRPLIVNLGGHEAYARVWDCPLPGAENVQCYLLEHNQFYDSKDVYVGPSGEEADNAHRFTFLSRAAIDLCYHLQWFPDVVHCHDWPVGLTPIYLNTTEWTRPMGRAASLMTLHNMQHQGWFHRDVVDYAGLPQSVFRSDGLESMGEANLLKGGIYHSTKITTVSPTYAHEIQGPDGGHGLHNLLRFRSPDLIGVINGIDEEEWSPETDPLLPENFSADDLSGKARCKAKLQEAYGLEVNPNIPLFTVVSRLVDQKGLDLLAAIGDRLMAEMQIQIAVLGTGDPALEASFQDLSERHAGRFGAYLAFSNELAHQTIAGADFLLMPSRFEPCGLSQMYAMAYGSPPIVRSTGGLIDSVDQYLEGQGIGTGFRFEEATADAFYYTIGWACATYYDRPDEYAQLQQNGMRKDFSWDVSARVYEDVYGWAIDARQAAFGG